MVRRFVVAFWPLVLPVILPLALSCLVFSGDLLRFDRRCACVRVCAYSGAYVCGRVEHRPHTVQSID